MKKIILIAFCFLSFMSKSYSQEIDSLLNHYNTSKQESVNFFNKENQLKKIKLKQEKLLSNAHQESNKLQEIEITQAQEIKEGLERENKLKKNEIKKGEQLSASLNLQNQLMQELIKQEKAIKFLQITLILILMVLAIIVYRSYLKQKENNDIITKQKKGIEKLNLEMHHRIKNNLTIIISILRMQARNLEDEKAINALKNSENRIQAIHQTHELLFKYGNPEQVKFAQFIENMVEGIRRQINKDDLKIVMKTHMSAELYFPPSLAIPHALILNELITNSYKYKSLNTPSEITITLQSAEDEYTISYTDNGPGFEESHFENLGKSLGIRLIKLFTEQLRGKVIYQKKQGVYFLFQFPIKQQTKSGA